MTDKRDFRIRIEVEEEMRNMGLNLTDEQIDDILDSIVMNEDLLDIITYYVVKELKSYANEFDLQYSDEVDELRILEDIRGWAKL